MSHQWLNKAPSGPAWFNSKLGALSFEAQKAETEGLKAEVGMWRSSHHPVA